MPDLTEMIEDYWRTWAEGERDKLQARLSAANKVWQDQEVELHDALARLSAAEKERDVARDLFRASSKMEVKLADQLKRAEAVVKAAQKERADLPLETYRAVRQYEEG